ncbi:MAG TPA: ATP-binding protein [Bryobacteraceae bacterium]|nr:ATP-binding protein [Bryobacteraceae bacterium]
MMIAASGRSDFPTDLEMIILRVAANQAVLGLQETRVLKRAEERLQRSEAQLADGQRLSHTGTWGWNVGSGELIFSHETFRILGFDPEKPAPSVAATMDRIHPDDRALVDRVIEAAIREREAYQFEVRLAVPDGPAKQVHCIGRPVINDSGDLEFIGTVLDITARRSVEERLEIAQSQLAHMARVTTMGELTASIAHEVNQPLTAIIANGSACLRWLAGKEPNLDEARDAVSRIINEANRACQIVAKTSAFMRKSQPGIAPVQINKLIHEVLALIRHRVLRDGVSLRCELAKALHEAQGDSVQLQQVILNLVVNAMEAMLVRPEGERQLLVSTANDGPGTILVGVRDSGSGVEPRSAEDIFKPFFTNKPGGMGMGLAISRSIIEAHGGKLWCVPNDDRGATFWFSLPITSSGLKNSEKSPQSNTAGGTPTSIADAPPGHRQTVPRRATSDVTYVAPLDVVADFLRTPGMAIDSRSAFRS